MNDFSIDKLRIRVARGRNELGKAAAESVAAKIRGMHARQAVVRIVFAAAPSQDEFLGELSASTGIEWDRVAAFHMDEYIGLPADASQLFGSYLDEHIFTKVKLKSAAKINGQSENMDEECARYSRLLSEAPIDIVCMGIGENGHVAFNDPAVADFQDRNLVKVVELDEACRMQQVNDGCFAALQDVPARAITLTVPMLMSARHLSIVVPGARKAEAVRKALSGKISESCPASIVRTHSDAVLYLDPDSASGLSRLAVPDFRTPVRRNE